MENVTRKDKIMRIALNLFSKKGVDSVTTREIAQNAKVNLSSIAYYFKTKDKLLSDLVEKICNDGFLYLKKEIDAAKNSKNLNQREKIRLFKTIMYKYISLIYSDTVSNEFIVLVLREQITTNSKYAKIYHEKVLIFYEVLKELLASICKKDKENSNITFLLTGMIGQILSFKMIEKSALRGLNPQKFDEKESRKINKFLCNQIRHTMEKVESKINVKKV